MTLRLSLFVFVLGTFGCEEDRPPAPPVPGTDAMVSTDAGSDPDAGLQPGQFELTVDATGGRLRPDDRSWTLDVPPGAVSEEITITVFVDEPLTATPPEWLEVRGPTFRFEPDGTTFAVPLELTVRYTQEDMIEGGLEERAQGFFDLAAGGSVEELEILEHDMGANTMTFAVEHFSIGFFARFAIRAVASGTITSMTAIDAIDARIQLVLEGLADDAARQQFVEDNADLLGTYIAAASAVSGTSVLDAFPTLTVLCLIDTDCDDMNACTADTCLGAAVGCDNVETAGLPGCTDPCAGLPNRCAMAAMTCDVDDLVDCADDGMGCLLETRTDCTLTGLLCADVAGVASCATPGDSCAAPRTIAADTQLTGADFAADFTDLHMFSDTSCRTRSGVPEVVLAIPLAAGERVIVSENGSVDVVMGVLTTCDDASVCLGTLDDPESVGLEHAATVAETALVYVSQKNAGASGDYDIDVNIVTCGDGIIDPGEECDDSNAAATDGCSSTCTREIGYTCVGVPSTCTAAVGDSCPFPTMVTADVTFTGADFDAAFTDQHVFDGTACLPSTSTTASETVFAVDLQAGEDVTLTEHGGVDVVYGFIATCADSVACLASDDGNETIGVNYVAAAAQTVYAYVSAWAAPAGPSTDYDIRFDINGCGDGLLGGAEQCDDGFSAPGDGCSATCQEEPGFDCTMEPSVCTPAVGDSCAAPALVSADFSLTGTDFGADFADRHVFDGTACVPPTMSGTADVVFAIDLAAGSSVTLSESGAIDVTLGLLPACANTTMCLQSTDTMETTGVSYTATVAETIYGYVSANAPTGPQDYDIFVDITP